MSDEFVPSNEVRPLPNYLPGNPVAAGAAINAFGAAQSENELREYLRMLYKYRLIIGLCTVVTAFIAVLYAFLATPEYIAAAKLRISAYEPILAVGHGDNIEEFLHQKSRESDYFETQVQEIKSLTLADQVLNDNAIKRRIFVDNGDQGLWSWLFGSSEKVDQVVGADGPFNHSLQELQGYLRRVDVAPVRRTSLVRIVARSVDPSLAAEIANRHAEEYIKWVRTSRIEQQSAGLRFLRIQAEELKQKVASLEAEIADYAEANSIVAVNKDENITVQRMSQLNKLLSDVTAERMEAENLYKEAQQALTDGSAGFDDPSVQTLRSKLAELEAEYGNLSSKFQPSYPRMQQLKAQIDNLGESIRAQRSKIAMGLKAKMLAAQQKEKSMRDELEQQKSKAFELSKSQVQYNILNRELESSRDLLQKVLRQIKETSLAVESNATNVSVVDPALIPTLPSYPRKRLIVVVGLLMGLGVGVLFALLLKYLDNTIRTPDQLVEVLQIPSLGVVPAFVSDAALPATGGQEEQGEQGAAEAEQPFAEESAQTQATLESEVAGDATAKTEGDSDQTVAPDTKELMLVEDGQSQFPIVYLDEPKSVVAEAYRTIRTGILLSQAGEPPRTILVSSAQSSEGKTTSATNLAAALASAGGRVCLIDADLRRPSVRKYFKIPREHPGLVEIITGQRSFEDVVLESPIKRVNVVVAGQIPPNPAELLGSIEMASFIDFLSANYDYVVIDSPPILPVTDSLILSRYVDGVLLVVRGGHTPRKVVGDARDRLEAVGARFLGAILNNVDVRSGDYQYYSRYYYSYYEEDEKRATKAA